MILGAEFVMSHITHFYHLAALDYIQGPVIPPWTTSGSNYFDDSYYTSATLTVTGGHGLSGDNFLGPAGFPNSKNLIYNVATATGDIGIVSVPVNINLRESTGGVHHYTTGSLNSTPASIDDVWEGVITDYVLALGARRKALEAASVFAGRVPFVRTFVAGGVTTNPTTGEVSAYKAKMSEAIDFVTGNYIPLTEIVAALYAEYDNQSNAGYNSRISGVTAGENLGKGHGNFLAFGVFNDNINGSSKLLGRGYATGCSVAAYDTGATGNVVDFSNIKEYIENSRYERDADDYDYPQHPLSGHTNPNYSNGYSWIKSPRYKEQPMEVGPLARMVVNGLHVGPGSPKHNSYYLGDTKDQNQYHKVLGIAANDVQGIPNKYVCGISVMDRHRARALECLKIALKCQEWADALSGGISASGGALSQSDVFKSWNSTGLVNVTRQGFGADEAPRGALSHWVNVKDGKIDRWQSVVPTTWLASPSGNSQQGPIEEALLDPQLPITCRQSNGTNVPVEALRVIHSFDPCIACAVHVVDGKEKKTERQVSKS